MKHIIMMILIETICVIAIIERDPPWLSALWNGIRGLIELTLGAISGAIRFAIGIAIGLLGWSDEQASS